MPSGLRVCAPVWFLRVSFSHLWQGHTPLFLLLTCSKMPHCQKPSAKPFCARVCVNDFHRQKSNDNWVAGRRLEHKKMGNLRCLREWTETPIAALFCVCVLRALPITLAQRQTARPPLSFAVNQVQHVTFIHTIPEFKEGKKTPANYSFNMVLLCFRTVSCISRNIPHHLAFPLTAPI